MYGAFETLWLAQIECPSFGMHICTPLAVLHILYFFTNGDILPKRTVVFCFTHCKDVPCTCAIYLHHCLVHINAGYHFLI